jgi:hypothetical protein
MIGHLYTLLFVGAEAPPAVVQPQYFGGVALRKPAKRDEVWKQELERLFAEPEPEIEAVVEPAPAAKPVSVPLTRSQQAYFDGLYAEIVRAKNEQERAKKQALAASAAQEAAEAQTLLAEAIEAERVAKRRMMDFDIAFVASVLANA